MKSITPPTLKRVSPSPPCWDRHRPTSPVMRSTTAFPGTLPLSREFETAVLRCAEEVRGKRFGTLSDVAVALADFGSKRAKPMVERIRVVTKPTR